MRILPRALTNFHDEVKGGRSRVVEICYQSDSGDRLPVCALVVLLERGEDEEEIREFSNGLLELIETHDQNLIHCLDATCYIVTRPYRLDRRHKARSAGSQRII